MTGHDTPRRVYIGCAGWNLPRAETPASAANGTQLERYASVFRGVEINSSFHRPHRRGTYERWSETVPPSFRFSVKVPRAITHDRKLVDVEPLLAKFLQECTGLGGKLGCVLVQLPPSLVFDLSVAEHFFEAMRRWYEGRVVIEPRHKTWFAPDSSRFLSRLGITRAAADPAVVPTAAEPGGNPSLVYFRLHGSPQVYASSYTIAYLDALAFRIRAYARAGATIWCIFDNTIKGAATVNAMHLARRIALEEAAVSVR